MIKSNSKLLNIAGVLSLVLLFAFLVFGVVGAQGPEVDISISSSIASPDDPDPPPPPPPPPTPGSPSTVILPFPGEIVISGGTSPEALVTIRIDGETAATVKADSSGEFQRRIGGLLGGTYDFSVFSEDSVGRLSSTFNFTAPIFKDRTTLARGIFLSPTISAFPQLVLKGGNVFLFGSSMPDSLVNIFISTPGSSGFIETANTSTNSFGHWLYRLETQDFSSGWHQVAVFAISPEGSHSPFSQTVQFFIRTPDTVIIDPPPPTVVPEIEIPTDPTPIPPDEVLPPVEPPEIDPETLPDLEPITEEPREIDLRSIFLFLVFFILPTIIALFLLFVVWKRRKKEEEKS